MSSSAPEPRRTGVACVLLLLAGLSQVLPAPARAQDAHYWAIPYGPIGQLLGGALIGSARDLSATFYNPGGLILTKDPTFLVSVDALDRERLRVEVGGDEILNSDLSATRTTAAPSIIAGALPQSLSGPGARLAWSYLPRFDVSFRANERQRLEAEGGAFAATEIALTEDMSESWFGVTWSQLLDEGTALGGTGYLAYRGHHYRSEFNAQIDPAGLGATTLLVDNARYNHYRLLAKLGLAMDRGPFQLGLTLTTPSLGLFGSGDLGFTRSLTGVDLDGDGTPDPYLLSAYEDDIDADYSSSWAIGAGGSWRAGKTRLHLSAEWYNSVEKDVLTSEPISPGQGLPEMVLELDENLDDVINVGTGIEYELQEKTSLYGAFSFDQSALGEPHDAAFALARWDLYHLTVGAAARFLGSRITGGIGYTFGSADQDRLFGQLDPDTAPLEPENIEMSYRQFTFLIGFELGDTGTPAPAEE